MNLLILGKIGISTVLGTLTINRFIEREMNNPNIETFKPIDTVSIIIPSYNEEKFIKKSLSSIRGQSILQEYSEFFETILIDSGSTDNTVPLAESYVDKVIQTKTRGKLTARNLATLQSNGNIIVSVDSDCYYPPFWLNTLLEPFNNISDPNYNPNISGVVGSTSDPYIPGIPMLIMNFKEILARKILDPNKMIGRNSAYYKHVFYQTGLFNENVNQMDVTAMVKEEEQDFGTRLSKIGNVKFKLNANCIHLGGERIGCRLGTLNKEICKPKEIGIQRFG